MGMFFFYNNRKPRKFNYKPILFNPDEEARKEQMSKRIQRIREEIAVAEGKQVETPQEKKEVDFGEEFLSQTKYLKRRKEREKEGNMPFFTRNFTLVLLLIALVVIFYLLFFR